MQKVNLCEQCAEDKGVTDPKGFALADLLEGTDIETTSLPTVATHDGEKCGYCGFTQADFKKTGRFGCSHCYQVFRSGLDNLLEAMHRNTEHHGKVPTQFIDAASAEEKATESFMNISELNTRLDEAISIEDYEEAARLRDSIAQLKNPSDDLEKDQYNAE